MWIIFFYLLLIVFSLFYLFKVILFCFYVWQNYEYRRDRILAYLRSTRFYFDLWDLVNPLNLFFVRRPKLTAKMIVLMGLDFYTMGLLFNKSFRFLAYLFHIQNDFFLSLWVFVLALIIITPLLTSLLTLVINWPSQLVKYLIIRQAKNKIRQLPNLITIGITGSYGKTSTKEILFWILSSQYRVVRTEGTVNTAIGVARTILKKLRSDTEIFIVEMGAYRKNEIKQVCQLVKPRIGIITGINQQHLELFGSQRAIVQAKYELIQSLPREGLAVFNITNRYCHELYAKTKLKKIGYRKPRKKLATNLEADFLQENIQGAIKVAQHLKIDPKKILKSIKKIPAGKHYLQKKSGLNKSIIFDNSYNTNPDSFLASLELLKKTPKQKNIVITPGIIELGSAGKSVHKKIARKISQVAQTVILTNRNYYSLFKKELDPKVKLIAGNQKTNFDKLINRNIVLLEGRIPLWIYHKLVKGPAKK